MISQRFTLVGTGLVAVFLTAYGIFEKSLGPMWLGGYIVGLFVAGFFDHFVIDESEHRLRGRR